MQYDKIHVKHIEKDRKKMHTIHHRSPNFDKRQLKINKIVLHYTDMLTAHESISRLCDVEAKVSAHYLIDTDGTIHELVDELDRAWHAGVSFWAEEEDLNSSSIGIELQNRGQQHGYEDFPNAQIEALIILINDIKTRYKIVKQNVLAHSDIAPDRKIDPDYKFPWVKLADANIVIAPEPVETDIPLLDLCDMIGYDISNPKQTIEAFQRRYRPSKIDGIEDRECQHLAMGVILAMERI